MDFPQYDKKRRILIDLLLEQSMRSGFTSAALITLMAFIVWHTFPETVIVSWLLVARQLNEGPHETLEFETPAERFNACVASTS